MVKSRPDIARIREEYAMQALREEEVAGDPITQFNQWFDEAVHAVLPLPNAMLLATATKDGRPSSRVMLLKGVDDNGFRFFTNYQSRKGKELSANPYAAMTFFWPQLERQVRIEGGVSKVTTAASDEYFKLRPRGSQLGAWASKQGNTVSSRKALEAMFREAKTKFADKSVPRPAYWGGYRLKPDKMEFWQGRPNRLHDRLLYLPVHLQTGLPVHLQTGLLQANRSWKLVRLAP